MSIGAKTLYIVPSATDTVTNTTAETPFAKTIPIPAETLRKGDRFTDGRATVSMPSTNSTDTFAFAVYLGPASAPQTGILLCDSTAYDAADNDVMTLEFDLEVDAVGGVSVAAFTGSGKSYRNGQTAVSKTRSYAKLTDAQVSSFADLVVAVTCTQSAQSTSNVARLDRLSFTKIPALPSV